jgi:uncharacterized protein YndB with AHSA1/START domain
MQEATAMAYEISTSIEIAATPQNVWAVLADLASYPQWHPAYRSVTGQLAAGSKLTITTTDPATGHPKTVKVKVLTAEPGTELQWSSKLLGIPVNKRRFLLSPSSGGSTLLMQTGTYRGLGGTRDMAAAQSIRSPTFRALSWRSTRPSSGKPRRGLRAPMSDIKDQDQ